MAVTQLRAELLHELNPIFDSEKAMKEVLNAIRRIRLTYIETTSVSEVKSKTNKSNCSARLQWLHDNPIRLTQEDLKDERINYLLSK